MPDALFAVLDSICNETVRNGANNLHGNRDGANSRDGNSLWSSRGGGGGGGRVTGMATEMATGMVTFLSWRWPTFQNVHQKSVIMGKCVITNLTFKCRLREP